KLKVLLVQLPVPCFGLVNDFDNFPLAAGYLKAMAFKEGLLDKAEIEIADRECVNLPADAELVERIVSKSPQVLGFSMYIWNSVRSLYIAGEVKKKLPGTTIIAGGADVTAESGHILSSGAVDIGVMGSGEAAFCKVLRRILEGKSDYRGIKGIFYREGGRPVVNGGREALPALADIPSPYLLGYLEPERFDTVWVETMRGCAFRCAYCTIGGQRGGRFPVDRVCREIELIAEKGGRSVGFTDSSIISSPHFFELCGRLKKIRKKYGLTFFSAVFAEHLTEQKAALLKECGFDDVDVGLQSVNPAVLKAVGRRLDAPRFLAGIRLLEGKGIRYNTDVIIGLPGDTPAGFRRTLRFIRDNKLQNTIRYVLRVLPGTRLRKEAAAYGIRYRKEPPYEIVESPGFPAREVEKATARIWAGQRKSFLSSFSSCCRYRHPDRREDTEERIEDGERFNKVLVRLDAGRQTAAQLRRAGESMARRIQQPFTVHFICEDAGREQALMRAFARPIAEANPYLVWNVIVESESPFGAKDAEAVRKGIPTREKISVFPAVSLYALFPWKRKPGGGKKLRELGEEAVFYWAVNVRDPRRWKQDVDGALKEAHGRGIVVDFDPALELSFVKGAVRYLEEQGARHGRDVHFRDIALAYAAEGTARAGRVIESVAETGTDLKARRLLSAGPETVMALLSWQMKFGKQPAELRRPVTCCQPFRWKGPGGRAQGPARETKRYRGALS
ncbi:MAG: B12-binding domain-containing radical SAM protein, partial [Endomicrobiales bacterium]